MAAGFFVRNLLIGLSLFVAVGAKGLMIDDFSTGEGKLDWQQTIKTGSMVGGTRYTESATGGEVAEGVFRTIDVGTTLASWARIVYGRHNDPGSSLFTISPDAHKLRMRMRTVYAHQPPKNAAKVWPTIKLSFTMRSSTNDYFDGTNFFTISESYLDFPLILYGSPSSSKKITYLEISGFSVYTAAVPSPARIEIDSIQLVPDAPPIIALGAPLCLLTIRQRVKFGRRPRSLTA